MKLFNLKTLAALIASAVLFSGTANAETTLRFGYEAPRSDTQHTAAKKFNDLLKEKSKGEIKLSLFPDSTLGNAQTMIGAVRGGTIDIEMSGSPNFSGLEPKLNVIDIPFIFKNREHAYAVLDGEIGQGLLKDLEAQGLKGLAFWEVGFRSFTNSKHPVKSPEDIKGLKVRTNQNPMYIQAFSLLGANPVPMPLSELYTALETRAVDAQEHPIGIFWSAKLYEVQKHLSLTNHGYTPLIVVMNKAKFDSFSPELQQAILDAAKEAGNYQRQLNLENEKEIIAKLQKAGIQVIEEVDNKPFKAIIEADVRKAFIEKNGSELVEKIDGLAK
ncbi:TRAP transporter substrate-binding protein [Glaesserella parasuis]|uniref:TRAP transporter substrate-binding protein n=1 Tax=Glaesserella parasuis TaxID=738 RepID=UPI0003AC2870|nr:TRAP transporter substrate-binding protein [Glaesserella parasuis]EPZ99460.1 2,3-diketo-L-gulonate-binding periplasmic protein yiaO [Glaesserella parasuis MN-H]EQA04938.1 2,3-diketo-L-gulonate-binding periplasmic protein yiaO [Glaesserella parasuis 12939]MCT8541154.1 TRAP transporter substrate-binding protein [Glaesserella parasuis]MCT8557298.1 TRAP transporter substrate-binding protein [Glaesserella parasuis]MCT8560025.1 TRAP transporter substrate-binding protein [Glaesserella parasuis]